MAMVMVGAAGSGGACLWVFCLSWNLWNELEISRGKLANGEERAPWRVPVTKVSLVIQRTECGSMDRSSSQTWVAEVHLDHILKAVGSHWRVYQNSDKVCTSESSHWLHCGDKTGSRTTEVESDAEIHDDGGPDMGNNSGDKRKGWVWEIQNR